MKLREDFFVTRIMVLVVALMFCGFSESASAAWEPLAELKAPDPCESALFGKSVSTDGVFAAISAYREDNYRGAVYIYEVNDSELDYVTTLLPPDLSATDRFGYSVCIDSNKLVVGTYYAEEVYVYDYNGTEWNSSPEILSVAGSHKYFGSSVAIDSNTIVVGAYGNIDQTGNAYVFDYNGVSWDYKQTLTNPGGHNGDGQGYGRSICIDGNVVVVGSDEQFEVAAGHLYYRRGAVCVFRRSLGTWSLEQKIVDPDTDDLDKFGYSVGVSGDTFVAGVYNYDYGDNGRAGAAFVYKWNGSSWAKEATLYDPNVDTSDHFGNSVAIDGNSIVVGEKYYDGNALSSGAAFLFERSGGSWSQGQKLEDPSGAASDYFGHSVAIDGEVVIACAYKDDEGQIDSGVAFMFRLLIADLNQDGLVDFKDFAILGNQWLQVPGNPSADIAPGSGSDDFVEMLDLKVLTEQWLRIGSPYIPSP